MFTWSINQLRNRRSDRISHDSAAWDTALRRGDLRQIGNGMIGDDRMLTICQQKGKLARDRPE